MVVQHRRYQLAGRPQPGRVVGGAAHGCRGRACIAGAHQDRAQAHELTKSVLDEARADAVATPTRRWPSVRRYAARSRGCTRNGRTYWSPGCGRDGA